MSKAMDILLCCIKPLSKTSKIDENTINQIFTSYGDVNKVVIFEDLVLVKAFIQMKNKESYKRVLQELDDVQYNIGRIRVFPSKKKNLKDLPQTQTLERSKGHATFFNDSNLQNQYLKSNSTKSPIGFKRKIEFGKREIKMDGFQSRVLIISKLNKERVSPTMLMNFIGCFGNVVKLIFNNKSNYCLIEMGNHFQILFVIKTLKNLEYFGSKLKISISKYKNLNIKSLKSSSDMDYLVFKKGQKKRMRFPKYFITNINILSKTLKFEFVQDKREEEIDIYKIISSIYQPKKFISVEPGIPPFIVEFFSRTQSSEVLSIFHNKKLADKFLKVSFVPDDIEI